MTETKEPRKARGTLPKAYLRIDPNLDQTHPDCGAFVRLLCAGCRQPIRGRFKTWAVLVNAVGRRLALRHRDEWRDVHLEGEALVIDGWDIWQEGDLTVGERMKKYREKLRTRPVTSYAPEPSLDRIAPSEALGQQGSKASGTDAASPPEGSPEDPVTDAPALETTAGAAAMTEEQRQEYAEAVWEAFRQHSGSRRALMNATEFDLVRQWMAELPLRVVLQGIRDCAGKGASTLRYYRDAVREEAQRWSRAIA